jgi:hypothetical protein
MRLEIVSIIFAVLLCAGCTSPEPRLPPGVYREKSVTPNFIDVSNALMRIHIDGVDYRDTNQTGLAFEYVLWPSGRLFPVVSRSVEMLSGYPGLDYHWNGQTILVTNRGGKAHWEFQK